jgi:hypothetical protein
LARLRAGLGVAAGSPALTAQPLSFVEHVGEDLGKGADEG